MDDVHPTVTAITRAPTSTPHPRVILAARQRGVTDASSLTFRVDFSEPVDGTSLTYDTGEGVFPRFDIIALQSSDNTDVASSFSPARLSRSPTSTVPRSLTTLVLFWSRYRDR